MRVMQTEERSIRERPAYRERLSPSLWTLVAAAVCAPMAALVFAPVDATLALIVGLLVGIGIVAALIAASPVIEVQDGMLRAGAARIEVRFLGEPAAAEGEEARRARGTDLDPRSWLLIRGGVDGTVTIPLVDPDDPTPAWVLSSRTPDRLSAAIRRAQITQRTPRR